MEKTLMKNKMVNNTSEQVAAAGTDSSTKFKWSKELAEDLLKPLSNFKAVMEFQNKDFNVDKPRQYEEVTKEIVKMNDCSVEYFGSASLPWLPSDMDEEEEIGLLKEQ